jgi:hypothetical protein
MTKPECSKVTMTDYFAQKKRFNQLGCFLRLKRAPRYDPDSVELKINICFS